MATNIIVTAKGNESSDRIVRRFLKKCKKQDIVREYITRTAYFKSKGRKEREKRLRAQFIRRKEKENSLEDES